MLEDETPDVKMLVNCSGYGKFDHYENISPEVNQNMIDLNVKAVVGMVDATLPHISKGGKIINIASCAGFQPIPYINIYAATKAFVLSYTRALNVELGYKNITATAVCPYWTKTEFFDRAIVKTEKAVVIKPAPHFGNSLCYCRKMGCWLHKKTAYSSHSHSWAL